MAKEAGVVGNLTVGTASSKDINLILNWVTESFTDHVQLRQTLTGGGGQVTLGQGNITTIAFFYFICVTAADETIYQPVAFEITKSGPTNLALPVFSSGILICNPKAQADMITTLKVTPAAANGVLEYILAGD